MSSQKQVVIPRLLQLLAITCIATVFSGCGPKANTNYDAVDLVEVTGTVKLDGSPVSGVTVVFESENKSTSSGKTDSSGKYALRFDSNKMGVIPGEKTVRIRFGGPEGGDGDEGGGEDENGQPIAKKVNKIPEKYNTKSELKRTVEKGKAAQVFDFDLKSS